MRTALLVSTFCVALAHAHDFWIEPSNLRPELGSAIKVGLRVGDQFPGEAVPRNDQRIVSFVCVDSSGKHDILGKDGMDPAGLWRCNLPGAFILGYRSNDARIELDARKFEKYLAEEGLDHVLKLRAQRGDSAKPARELYSRAAKSIVVVGDAPLERLTVPLDFRLEIVPESNPAQLTSDKPFQARVLFEGKPLADALVKIARSDEPTEIRRIRTNADGRINVPLSPAPLWKISVVHMTVAPKEADADWQSVWASLTFAVPPALQLTSSGQEKIAGTDSETK